MSLREQLMSDMKDAMRAHDTLRLGAIRFLLAQIKNTEIDNGPQTEAQLEDIVRKQIKQMKDAINDYQKGNRTDLVAEEEAKVLVLQKYLPAQMSSEELAAILEKIVAANAGAQMGQIIGLVRAEVAGKADGGEIATLVKQKLQ